MLYLNIDYMALNELFPHVLFFHRDEWDTLHHTQGRGWDVTPAVKKWLEENIGSYQNPYKMNPDGKLGAWTYEIENLSSYVLRPYMSMLENGYIYSEHARRCAFLAFRSEDDAMRTKLFWG